MCDAAEIERAVAAFARASNGGLVVTSSALTVCHRDLIIALAARYRLPAVYFARNFVAGGGLIAYGPNQIDPCRRPAGYVDQARSISSFASTRKGISPGPLERIVATGRFNRQEALCPAP